MDTPPEPGKKREGRIARHRRIAAEIYHEPKAARGYLRQGFVTVWVSRGAGFYGLGWIVTFILLEVNMLVEELGSSAGVGEFLGEQVVSYLVRVGLMSFINSLQAFLWPVLMIDWLDVWGLVLLVAGYLGFEYGLRPLVEGLVPELKAHREAVQAKKDEKARKKAEKAAAKQRSKAEK